jgi:hypothetical protein
VKRGVRKPRSRPAAPLGFEKEQAETEKLLRKLRAQLAVMCKKFNLPFSPQEAIDPGMEVSRPVREAAEATLRVFRKLERKEGKHVQALRARAEKPRRRRRKN